jgi:hypothetical protein
VGIIFLLLGAVASLFISSHVRSKKAGDGAASQP